mmetsp:Transcript_14705/g.33322  ORF Transcript_14705/g.33322 Transcript_14705/m.33322 type:complete len:89 (-) Transcript_14705:152-418(-)
MQSFFMVNTRYDLCDVLSVCNFCLCSHFKCLPCQVAVDMPFLSGLTMIEADAFVDSATASVGRSRVPVQACRSDGAILRSSVQRFTFP